MPGGCGGLLVILMRAETDATEPGANSLVYVVTSAEIN